MILLSELLLPVMILLLPKEELILILAMTLKLKESLER